VVDVFKKNLSNISVTDKRISDGTLPSAGNVFIALADVADLVWRNTRHMDEANHFADMDQPGGPQGTGKTLMQLWKTNPATRTPQAWTAFYDDLPNPPEDKHRGALPFRVKEMYEAMVDAVNQKHLIDYVAIAGLMAHYVGDACQPLHVSQFHHGHPAIPKKTRCTATMKPKCSTASLRKSWAQ
jgi:hypothetical protein